MNVDIMATLSQIPIITIIDYLGVTVGVIAGTLFAINRKMDILGAASLGLVTGFGGGIIRDLLLQDQGIFFMEHPMAVLGSICISVILSLGRRHLVIFDKLLFYTDAFTMAWYVLAGASKCWFAGSGAVMSAILGSVTAVGGGALRDICVGEIPRVFLPGKYYGVSSVIAALFYVVPVSLGAPHDISSVLCVAVGFLLTVLSERFNWHTHGFEPSISDHIIHGKNGDQEKQQASSSAKTSGNCRTCDRAAATDAQTLPSENCNPSSDAKPEE